MSNEKQLGATLMLYTQDYDETYPTLVLDGSTGVNIAYDASTVLMSYLKNQDIFFCPDRTTSGCNGLGVTEVGFNSNRCIGYGYNFGVSLYIGGGMLQPIYQTPTQDVATGQSLAALIAPAETFAFGDTYDYPFYTIVSSSILSNFAGNSNAEMRHRGQFNMLYADGHAKTMHWQGGVYTDGTKIAFPSNPADYGKWCADPNAPAYPGAAQTCLGYVQQQAAQTVFWQR